MSLTTNNVIITKIKSAKAFTENNRLFLDLTVEEENDIEIRTVRIPRLFIPYRAMELVTNYYDNTDRPTIVFHDDFVCCTDKKGNAIYSTVEKKERTMTLSEIEAKLGHKIKLVSEKE